MPPFGVFVGHCCLPEISSFSLFVLPILVTMRVPAVVLTAMLFLLISAEKPLFENLSVVKTVDISEAIVKVTIRYQVSPSQDDLVDYQVAIPNSDIEHMAYIEVSSLKKIQLSLKKDEQQPMCVFDERVTGSEGVTLYTIHSQEKVAEKSVFYVYYYLTHVFVPHPAAITQVVVVIPFHAARNPEILVHPRSLCAVSLSFPEAGNPLFPSRLHGLLLHGHLSQLQERERADLRSLLARFSVRFPGFGPHPLPQRGEVPHAGDRGARDRDLPLGQRGVRRGDSRAQQRQSADRRVLSTGLLQERSGLGAFVG